MELTAQEILDKLAELDGALVKAEQCSTIEEAHSKMRGLFFVDRESGQSYVLRSESWITSRENAFRTQSEGSNRLGQFS